MSIRIKAIHELQNLLGSREAIEVLRLAKKQDRLEAIWRRKMQIEISKITKAVLENYQTTGRLKLSDVNFDRIVMEHSLSVMRNGIASTNHPTPVRAERLAAPPPSRIPKSLRSLRILWDQWKKTKKLPPRQKVIAGKLKKAYIKKLHEVFQAETENFRSGNTASNTEAVEAVMKGADVVYSRAKMIVDTETTYYYNKARREIYDESPDVTHYLFVAIRDHATTNWCKSRHGLVYKKGDPILDKETPPIHWNCRSEILPLTAHNPNHLRLIENSSLQRRNNRCVPLPTGWTQAS